MCEQCEWGDDENENPDPSPGLNWPTIGTSKLNWTDPAIVVASAVEMTGNMVMQLGALTSNLLRAHSNTIAVKQRDRKFKRDANTMIEALSAPRHRGE